MTLLMVRFHILFLCSNLIINKPTLWYTHHTDREFFFFFLFWYANYTTAQENTFPSVEILDNEKTICASNLLCFQVY